MSVPTSQIAPVVQTNVAGTSAVTICPAAGAGRSRDLVNLVVTTANAAAATLTISDGNKTTHVINYPNAALAPADPLILAYDSTPLEQSGAGNAAWTITASANASGYNVSFQYQER
jgi:hypothetical protein